MAEWILNHWTTKEVLVSPSLKRISDGALVTEFFFFFFWSGLPLPSLLLLGPYNSNSVFDIVPGVSETVLSSFHSFYFILLFRSYFQHFILQLTDLFFCFRYSAIDSF